MPTNTHASDNGRWFLTRREIAHALGVSLRTLDRLVEDGIPRLEIGGRPRFDEVEVRAWLRKHKTHPVKTGKRGRPRGRKALTF